jgi:hypothetical protein
MSPTPARPGNTRIELLTQEKPVNWLDPRQLLQTALRTSTATSLGSFADPRLMQAALDQSRPGHDSSAPTWQAPAQSGPIWLDYLADTGDGWDSTYTVAYSVGADQLRVSGLNETLPRAQILLLGGDQVYPTPADGAYRTRFLDPFRSALPADVPPQPRPDDPRLYALPGNHDWYDGLNGFNQIFCTGQPIGRWQTGQRRSYYALQLPHGWWVWGLDLQLESALDEPQRQYFSQLAERLQAGDRVVLLTPEPSWIEDGLRRIDIKEKGLRALELKSVRHRSLRDIEQLIDARAARVAAVLAGDLHHYARYAPEPSTADQAGSAPTPQRITCGGGGAFLLGTHHLPEDLPVREHGRDRPYTLKQSYPPADESRALRNQAWRLPFYNPVFGVTLALFYLVWAWLLQSASLVPHAALGGHTLFVHAASQPLGIEGWRAMVGAALSLLGHNPEALGWAALLVGGAGLFTLSAAERQSGRALAGGLLHGLAHLKLTLLLIWLCAHLNLNLLASPAFDNSLGHALLVLVEMLVGGWLAGGILFGSWLVLANRWFGWHDQEVFSAQSITDWRCFLRMKLDADSLTIYPLGIRRACHDWQLDPKVEEVARNDATRRLRVHAGAGARLHPQQPIQVELIEPPIVIR